MTSADCNPSRHAVFTLRLLLAELLADDDARDHIVEEINDCPDCWRAIATRLCLHASCYMRECQSNPVALVQHQLAHCLDFANPKEGDPR